MFHEKIVYLLSFLKIFLLRPCVKEAAVFTFLMLWLILVLIFDSRKIELVVLHLFSVESYPAPFAI